MSPASCGAGVLGPQVQEDRDFQSGYFRGGGSIYVRDGERRPASAFVEPRLESPDLRSLWARLRKRGLSDMLGTGDLLFVLCMTPYFPPRHFLLFLIISSLATILFWLLYTRLSRTTARDIPLVTAFAICLTLQIVIRIILESTK